MKLLLVSSGSVLLLASFLSQQFIFERWNGRSADLNWAEANFLAFSGNSELFNAVYEIVPEDRRDRIRQLQLMNYQDGLTILWDEVSPEMRKALSARSVSQIGVSAILNARTTERLQEMGQKVQAQINHLVVGFREEQKRIDQKKRKAHLGFSVLYILGSLLIILGNFKLPKKSGKRRASKRQTD